MVQKRQWASAIIIVAKDLFFGCKRAIWAGHFYGSCPGEGDSGWIVGPFPRDESDTSVRSMNAWPLARKTIQAPRTPPIDSYVIWPAETGGWYLAGAHPRTGLPCPGLRKAGSASINEHASSSPPTIKMPMTYRVRFIFAQGIRIPIHTGPQRSPCWNGQGPEIRPPSRGGANIQLVFAALSSPRKAFPEQGPCITVPHRSWPENNGTLSSF